ncbi:MAG: 16S rRNA processing protein RimM [Treponema sp.]|nr:16S rRNA processing protein RimM [Treponema sp.]
MQEEFVVAVIRAPFGVAGICKVESTSGEYEHIISLKEVVLRNKKQTVVCTVESAELAQNVALMKFAGIESPEAIKKYCGWEIIVPRHSARKLKSGEWFIEDLKQCSLVYEGVESKNAPTKKAGVITDVLEGGGSFLFEVALSEDCTFIADSVKYTSSGKPRVVYVPFVVEHIGQINIEAKTVQLMHLWILE